MLHKAPFISVVSPVHGVAAYLGDFFASLDKQTLPRRLFEVIIVVDGDSGDGSAAIVGEWAKKTRLNVTVIHRENGGAARARNTGIAAAKGQWISCIDPDDWVADDYLAHLTRAVLEAGPQCPTLVVGRTTIVADTIDGQHVKHPLDWRFDTLRGPSVVELPDNPSCIQLAVNCTLVRRSALAGEKFRPFVKPTFEDGELISRVVRHDPRMLMVPAARYYYRKRADGSSAVQSSWTNPSRYHDVFTFGYLTVARREATKPMGAWTANMVMYDFGWIDRALATGVAKPDVTGDNSRVKLAVHAADLIRVTGDALETNPWEHFPTHRRAMWRRWLENGADPDLLPGTDAERDYTGDAPATGYAGTVHGLIDDHGHPVTAPHDHGHNPHTPAVDAANDTTPSRLDTQRCRRMAATMTATPLPVTRISQLAKAGKWRLAFRLVKNPRAARIARRGVRGLAAVAAVIRPQPSTPAR